MLKSSVTSYNEYYSQGEHFYRPQRSWGKVIFSQASVVLLTGGGLPQCMLGYHPPGADIPQSRHPLPRNRPLPPRSRQPPGADDPPGSTPRPRSTSLPLNRRRACWEIQVRIQGGPRGPGPPLTLGFEAPKLRIFGPYLIFPQFFLPRFTRHIISLICCLFIVQIEKFSSLASLGM